MKKQIALISILLSWAAAGYAQNANEPAFAGGERLEYAISYYAKLVPNSEVADVTIKTADGRYDSREVFRITGSGKVRPFFRWFFDINDTYESWLDKESLRPLKFTSDLREGKYRYSSAIVYDWVSMTADSKYRNHKRPTAKTKTLPLGTASYDALAQFFNLRATPAEKFTPGKALVMDLVLDDTVRKVPYKYLGRENVDVRGMGRFKSLKFSVRLTTSTGESFEDGTELFLWVSDDRNKIPLLIESPIKVGSVRVVLKGFSGLKYPLDSKIAK